jgi:hypothetical protein
MTRTDATVDVRYLVFPLILGVEKDEGLATPDSLVLVSS